MLSQKLTALVALMVFTSQDVIGRPSSIIVTNGIVGAINGIDGALKGVDSDALEPVNGALNRIHDAFGDESAMEGGLI